MARSSGAALVFAGEMPGSWWVVHASRPRFAGRLLTADEFAAEPHYAALLPHGIDDPLPVHFKLGADVLVVTDFIDPVSRNGNESPQQAILGRAMLDALHACTRAIAAIARRDPAFAPLSARSEQFLVGWQISGSDEDELDLLHAGGAQVRVRRDAEGDFNADLVQLPEDEAASGWAPALLHDRLTRIAGERAMRLFDTGLDRLRCDDGSMLALDDFEQAARGEGGVLRWSHATADGVPYVAFQLEAGNRRWRRRLAVELERDVPLTHADRPLQPDDAEAILSLLPMYGLHDAIHLVAAHRFGWIGNFAAPAGHPADDSAEERTPPYFPCEVELLADGEFYAAIAFDPPDRDGRYRLIVAPHAPDSAPADAAALRPFECVQVGRSNFRVPAYR